MKTETKTKYVGPSFLSLLCLLFVGLKLGGIITWSWWWVLAPLWGQLVIVFILFGLLAIAAVTTKK